MQFMSVSGTMDICQKLNTANPEVQAYIYNVMVFWLNEYHIDGWRLDVADEIDPSLWTRIRYRIKSAYPDCLLLGETWEMDFPCWMKNP